MKTKIPIKDQIRYIMDNFDFNRVRESMMAVHWVWHGEVNSPSVGELRDCAVKLLGDLTGKMVGSATGGLYARKNQYGFLSLYFYVTGCEATDLDETLS